MKFLYSFVVISILLLQCSFAQTATEKIDTVAINKIKDEGINRSQAMEILSYLTDVYGPRLTGSPEYKQAAEWTKQKLASWGLQNVYFDKWGPFGKGWSLKRFSANVLEPRAFPVIAYPKAWTPGLKGTVRGDVVYLDAKDEAGLEQYKGKLKGAFVLLNDIRDVKAHFDPEGKRLTDADLLKLANAGLPVQQQRRGGPNADSAAIANFLRGNQLASKKLEFCLKEGAAVAIDGGRGDGGTIFVGGASVPQPANVPFGQRVSAYDEKAPAIVPQVTVAAEH
ncbi:MAG: peptidase M28, partial [Ignavibacteriales bacterium]|nr:peptidase M28 [Ignavibacteriales bacterium]